jgi:hypothetical protein
MNRVGGGILILVLGLSVAAAQDPGTGKPATPAEQYQALLKEYHAASQDVFSRAKTDEERSKTLASVGPSASMARSRLSCSRYGKREAGQPIRYRGPVLSPPEGKRWWTWW